MHGRQYPSKIQDPPPYRSDMFADQQSNNHFRPIEERMAAFQQIVARYESEFIRT